ncbi:MAG TPA: hypothetical protein VK604_17765 [Bryobacteraceae bacterium]|nr:hypothetical protein [Bryobacteraceae bacterium]
MLIEYQITFQKDGVTIKQTIEPGASGGADPDVPADDNTRLMATYKESKETRARLMTLRAAAGGAVPANKPGGGGGGILPKTSAVPANKPGGGGGGPNGFETAPITFIGPFVFCWPGSQSEQKGRD